MFSFKKIPSRFLIFSFFLLILLVSYFRIFNNYEFIFYDLRMRLRPPLKTLDDILIIEISDDTLKNLGRWPLPRDFHASLIRVLSQFGAKSIVFDILFSEPTLYDEILVQAVKEAGNVYLPRAFYIKGERSKDYLPPRTEMVLAELQDKFQDGIAGSGHINTYIDSDGKVRRIPLFVIYKDKIFPNLALRVACDWLGIDSKKIEFRRGKVIIDNKIIIPVGKGVSFMVNYPGPWKKSFRHLSYFQILKGYADFKKGIEPEIDLSTIRNKICFIGLTATGTSDLKPIPLENLYPMLGLQASVFNSLIKRRFIISIGPLFNTLINLIISVLSFFISRKLPPLKALFLSIILGFSYFLISCSIFLLYGLLTDLFFPLFVIGLTYTGTTLTNFLSEIRKREILEKELDIARTIQKSFLPQEGEEISGLEISSFMEPAKFVAGDLYDILKLDDKRTGIFIGDVSGKGVPASLIMAQSISLFRVFSRQNTRPSQVLTRLNKELYGRFAGRFVTALFLVIDTEEKKIFTSSAGQAPLLFYKKRKNEILEIELSQGLPLGIIQEMDYQDIEVDIEEGDRVIIFTDGLMEARNRKGEDFGLERIKQIIQKVNNLSSQAILERLRSGLYTFSQGCPQHDDVTIIVVSVKDLEKL